MRLIISTIALLGWFATSLAAFEINEMTPEERNIFRQEVRAFLLERPEVLMEAIAVLEQRQAAAESIGDAEMVLANADALYADSNSYVGGNPDGDVVLVEFLDYRCGFCKRAHPEVTELIKSDGNIKYIVKEFPILGEQSVLASQFAISVLLNTDAPTYARVHDALMAFRGDISETSLERLAKNMDLDFEMIRNGMESEAVSSVIAHNRALAQRLQINGTPGFVFGDQMVRGYVPLDGMQQIVADLRLTSR